MAKSGGTPRRPFSFSGPPKSLVSSLNRAAKQAPDDTKLAMDRLRALQATAQAAASLEKRSERIALLTKVTAEAEALRAKYMASPQAQRSLERQAFFMERFNRLQKESAKASRGPGAEKEDERKRQQEQQLQAAIGTATALFRTGLSHIQSMVASSDFTTFATLTDSFKILSATIGVEFSPYIDAVSLKVQQLTKWFSGLDSGTKEWMARIAIVSVGALGFVMVLTKIGAAATALGFKLNMLGAHPALRLLMIAGAIYAGTRIATRLMSDDSNGQSGEQDNGQNNGGIPNQPRTMVERTRDVFSEVDPMQSRLLVENLVSERVRNLIENRLLSDFTPEARRQYEEAKTPEKKAEVLEQERKRISEAMRNDPSRATPEQRKKDETFIRISTQFLREVYQKEPEDLTRSYKLPVQSRFSGFSEYADSLQTNALNQDPNEARLLQIQLENTEKVAGLITRIESLIGLLPQVP